MRLLLVEIEMPFFFLSFLVHSAFPFVSDSAGVGDEALS